MITLPQVSVRIHLNDLSTACIDNNSLKGKSTLRGGGDPPKSCRESWSACYHERPPAVQFLLEKLCRRFGSLTLMTAGYGAFYRKVNGAAYCPV